MVSSAFGGDAQLEARRRAAVIRGARLRRCDHLVGQHRVGAVGAALGPVDDRRPVGGTGLGHLLELTQHRLEPFGHLVGDLHRGERTRLDRCTFGRPHERAGLVEPLPERPPHREDGGARTPLPDGDGLHDLEPELGVQPGAGARRHPGEPERGRRHGVGHHRRQRLPLPDPDGGASLRERQAPPRPAEALGRGPGVLPRLGALRGERAGRIRPLAL